MAAQLPLGLLLLAAASLRQASAQNQCDGTPIPEAQAMVQWYPTAFEIATIPDWDDEGRNLFQSINGTDRAALQFPPSQMTDGAIDSDYDYDFGNDPRCWWTASGCTSPNEYDLPDDFSYCPSPATWGLSIDDGPTCAHTPLYDMLQEQNQLASVYYIGSNVISHPAEAQRGWLDGHEVCVHTWSHHAMTTLTNEQAFAELYYTKKVIKEVVGYSPRCWRPPFGDVDDRIRTIAAALDMRTHLWDRDTSDWQIVQLGREHIEENYNNIFQGDYSQHGTIVLTHEVNEHTVSLLVEEYPNITARFQHVTPVSTCMNDFRIYGEDDAPAAVGFDAYLGGYRGEPRDSNGFFASDEVVWHSTFDNGDDSNLIAPSGDASSDAPSSAASSAASSGASSGVSMSGVSSASASASQSSIEDEVSDEVHSSTDSDDSSAAALTLPLSVLASSAFLATGYIFN